MENLRGALSSRLLNNKVIAVLRARLVSDLLPVCDVLVEENILGLEFTLTTPDLTNQLPALQQRYAAHADVGVGTVTTVAEAERAIGQGAGYLVTPTMNLAVVEYAVQRQVPVVPGGLTPSELYAGWAAGAAAVKIFPAQTVGPDYVRHLRGPFPDLLAVPSGGVDIASARAWVDAGAVAVSLGGPLLGDALAGGPLDELRARCRSLREALR